MGYNKSFVRSSLVVGALLVIVPILLGWSGGGASSKAVFLFMGPLPLILFLIGSIALTYGVAGVRRKADDPLTPLNTTAVPVLTAVLLRIRSQTVDRPQLDPGGPPQGYAQPPLEFLVSDLSGQTLAVSILTVAGVAAARRQWGWLVAAILTSAGIALVSNQAHPAGSLLLVGVVGLIPFAIGWRYHWSESQ